MRRTLQGRAGMGLAFMLGLLIATAGTAAAAKLITGRQIKDGSIDAKDLSKAVRAQLKTGGPAGPSGALGPKGDTGPQGDPAAYPTTLPSGHTQLGSFAVRFFDGTLGGKTEAAEVSFPLPLTGAPAVYCSASCPSLSPGFTPDVDTTRCAGTAAAPTAAPGAFCIYITETANLYRFEVRDTTGAIGLMGRLGGAIELHSGGNADTVLRGTWAVTGA